eukprot:GHVS01105314.1.p1 GENE.GHVS01105314.1~~GHVS01105314.1.p1  ORF type:complete len:222 (-),score=63.56 GHVS01105314.1:224-889(-)
MSASSNRVSTSSSADGIAKAGGSAVDAKVQSMYFDILNYKDSRKIRGAVDVDNAERFQDELQGEYQKELQKEREERLRKEDKRQRKILRLASQKGTGSSSSNKRASRRGSRDGKIQAEVPFFMMDASIRAAEKERRREKRELARKEKKKKEKKEKKEKGNITTTVAAVAVVTQMTAAAVEVTTAVKVAVLNLAITTTSAGKNDIEKQTARISNHIKATCQE